MNFKSYSIDPPLQQAKLPKVDTELTDRILKEKQHFLQISRLLLNLDSNCKSKSLRFIEKILSELSSLLKSDFENSNYCFQHCTFPTSSLDYLIDIYGQHNCTDNLRHYLTIFFIEATFHSQAVVELICNNKHTLNYLIDFFVKMKSNQKYYQEISDLILNLSTDAAFYSNTSERSLLIEMYPNPFPNDGKIDEKVNEKYSRFMINYFKFGSRGVDLKDPSDDIKDIIEYLQRWFWHYESGPIFKNLLWCVYFWFRNNPDFAIVLFQTPLWEIVIDQIVFDQSFEYLRMPIGRETQFKISLSICAMALHTDNLNFLRSLDNKFPLQELLSFIDGYNTFLGDYEVHHNESIQQFNGKDLQHKDYWYFNESYRLAFIYCTNYVSKNTQCVINMLEAELHLIVLRSFPNYPYDMRIEAGYLLTSMILNGDVNCQNCFCDTTFIQLVVELLSIEDSTLIPRLLESFIALSNLNPQLIMENLDETDIQDIMEQQNENENTISLASNLLSRLSNQPNFLP